MEFHGGEFHPNAADRQQILFARLDSADFLLQAQDRLTGLLLEQPPVAFREHAVVVIHRRQSAAQQVQIRAQPWPIGTSGGRWTETIEILVRIAWILGRRTARDEQKQYK